MAKTEILELENQADRQKQAGDHAAAIETCKRILELDETFVRGHLALSVLYHLTGNYPESCRHAERACELEPNDPFNYAALSVTYQRAFEGTRDPGYIEKAEWAMARSRG